MLKNQAQSWFLENSREFSSELLFDELLSRHTYYRIGGPASVFASPENEADIQWLIRGIRETGIPVFVLGAGSNLLVSDKGFSGLVIRAARHNQEISPIEGAFDPLFSDELPPLRLRTGAGVSVSSLLRKAMDTGWGGLEFLCGIPGTVGGAIFMNAGTHLGEVKDRIIRVTTISLTGAEAGRIRSFEGPELKFEYRKNLFAPEQSLIWDGEWALRRDKPEKVRQIMTDSLARRKDTQPINFPSCGSVFKNPKDVGMAAWQVVNQVGLRGHRVGNAQFSVKHSNFIVNLGGASAADVRALMELAQARARAELGIVLEPEVQFVGEW